MAEDKIYCGTGRKNKDWSRRISICLDDIPKEHIKHSEKNGKNYINLNVVDRKEPDKYNNDVSVSVDTFKPDPNYKNNSRNEGKETDEEYDKRCDKEQAELDGLPF